MYKASCEILDIRYVIRSSQGHGDLMRQVPSLFRFYKRRTRGPVGKSLAQHPTKPAWQNWNSN